MKVEIKGAKEFHGHDGQGFDASLYVNGTRTAIVSDDGWGGEWMYDVLHKENFAVLQEAIEPLTWISEYDKSENPMCLDIFLSGIVDEAFTKKDARGNVITKNASGLVQIWNGKFKALDAASWKKRLEMHIDGEFEVVNNTLGIRVF